MAKNNNLQKNQDIDENVEILKAKALLENARKKNDEKLKKGWEFIDNYLKENGLSLNCIVSKKEIANVVNEVVNKDICYIPLRLEIIKK